MPIHLNLLFVASYGIVAAAIAVAVPIDARSAPFILGGLVLALGGLVHAQIARLLQQRETAESLRLLGAAQHDLQSEIEALRLGVARAETAVQAAPEKETRQVGAVSEIVSEVRVLQSLIEKLYTRRAAQVEEAVEAEPFAAMGGGRAGVARGAPRPLPAIATGLDDAQILDIVRDGLKTDRIDLFLQPVVSLPQRKRRFYECYSRIRGEDGSMITPEQYLAIAAREGLLGAIDNMLLFRCVQLVRKTRLRHREVGFFCNISPNNLSDQSFFTEFVEFMAQNAELAPHLFFEFAQSDVARFDRAVLRQLAFLASHGFRFSLDRVSDLRFDLRELRERGFAFIKIEAGFLLRSVGGESPVLDLRRLKDALDRTGIDLVVEKVESDQQLIELLDYRIDYAQGFLFGEPRPSRDA
jgi:cyclic-di-GMP phosphodiesterase TipF (flagellum assembly factor)